MKGGFRELDIRTYLKLENRNYPMQYRLAIYNKLKSELIAELVFGALTRPEDVQKVLRRYNDKWNDIRNEYAKIYGDDPILLPEDWFQERYCSEMYTEESLRKMDEFFMLDKAIRQEGE